jgi:hypothetical protein
MARSVRDAISEKYEVEHPTLLTYELTAHLLKHRFLDAVISFNFDELLDRSLLDELSLDEFSRLVSERDCRTAQTDPYAPNYVPLYIKLHGTASEPDSLRFTPDAYYSLPRRLLQRTEELLRCEHCVIVTLGFGLESFDFQRLLGLPGELEIYNLSFDDVKQTAREKIQEARLLAAESGPPHKVHSRERREKRRRAAKKPETHTWLRECKPDAKGKDGCDELMTALIAEIQRGASRESKGLVQFRSIARHEAVATLLGPGRLPKKWATEPARWQDERVVYSYRRTVLELALAGAKARGLLSLGPLAQDRPARYFDDYRRLAGAAAEPWPALCSAAGLIESKDAPDRLVSRPDLRPPGGAAAGLEEEGVRETHVPHLFEPRDLARNVLRSIKNPVLETDVALLERTIVDLQGSTEVELRTRDDRVCSKAFLRPVTLTTATALEAHLWLILNECNESDDRVLISDENGQWLTRTPMQELLKKRKHIRLMLAFPDRAKELHKTFPKIEMIKSNPWRHNRHMVIVCRGDRPHKSVYWARRLRSPVVTTVYLPEAGDSIQLERIFSQRWQDPEQLVYEKERWRTRPATAADLEAPGHPARDDIRRG